MRRLERLARELGLGNEIVKIPRPTVSAVLTHPDDALIVSETNPSLELLGYDNDRGYSVFDPNKILLYSTPSTEEAVWGLLSVDQMLLLSLPFGSCFYLVYETVDGYERAALVVKGN